MDRFVIIKLRFLIAIYVQILRGLEHNIQCFNPPRRINFSNDFFGILMFCNLFVRRGGFDDCELFFNLLSAE